MRASAILLALLAGCAGKSPQGTCVGNSGCDAGEVCTDGVCQVLCTDDSGCPSGQVCRDNLCVGGASTAPVIANVDGDSSFSGVCRESTAAHCVYAGLVVQGSGLSGAAWQVLGAGGTRTLPTRAGATDTRVELDWPDGVTGMFTLRATNAGGSTDQSVQVLQGEPGPAGSADTGAQILAKLQLVDGDGSGLDADTVDGVESADLGVPVGGIMAFVGTTAPGGWLMCDGAAVSRTAYAALFGVIGISHGGGDGTATFNLPDYRGRFLRGVDDGAGRDPDRAARTAPQPANVSTGVGNTGDAVGSVQGVATARPATALTTDSQGAHTHTYSDIYYTEAGGGNVGFGTAHLGSNGGVDYDNGDYQFSRTTGSAGAHTHSTTGGGDAETRPINAYVNYIIKY